MRSVLWNARRKVGCVLLRVVAEVRARKATNSKARAFAFLEVRIAMMSAVTHKTKAAHVCTVPRRSVIARNVFDESIHVHRVESSQVAA